MTEFSSRLAGGGGREWEEEEGAGLMKVRVEVACLGRPEYC